jgi:hypothetical protein
MEVIEHHEASGYISRADLLAYSKAAVGTDDSTMVRLFVATMIWGSGTSNGRGPMNTAAALHDERLGEALKASHSHVVSERVPEAYRVFRVHRVGPSFFTKWFWAAGLAQPLRLTPLILDSRVWDALGAVRWNSIDAAGSRLRRERYAAYLVAMDRWWHRVRGVESPEALENVMFQWAGR